MSATMFHRRRAERFAQLVEEVTGGRRHHARTQLDARLAELVAIGHQISALPPTVEIDPEFRTGLRAMLVATAERDGIGRTADPTPAHRVPTRRPGTRRAPASRRVPVSSAVVAPGRIRARGAIVVGVAVGAIAVAGMSAASENAVPGDALYGVKRSTERTQLALASSDITRGQLYLDFARNRVAEAGAIRNGSDSFGTVLDDMDNDTIQGVRLLDTASVRRREPAGLDVVEAFLITQHQALTDLRDRRSGDDQTRTMRSLALLDTIGKRIDALRPTLSCNNAGAGGTDQLGPKPAQCATGVPRTTAGDPPAGQAPAGGGVPAAPRTEKSGSTTPAAPSDTNRSVPTAPNDPATTADDGGVLGDIGRIFDGLLG